MLEAIKKDLKGVRNIWKEYWALYGGFRALFSSTYFFVALFITVVNFGAWIVSGWWDVVISAAPTILGFTLAGLAVFLGMDTGFSKFMARAEEGKKSPFMILVSAFVHFIVVQCAALLYSLTMKSLSFTLEGMPAWYYQLVFFGNRVFWFLGYFLFVYAIVLIFSATFAIFRATKWYGLYVQKDE